MAALRLYLDPISGNCSKVQWTAQYLGVDAELIFLDIRKGETRTEAFLALNPFGQVPCAVFDDGRVLTQSNAIALYLAEQHGDKLLPQDPFERACVFEWMFWEQNSHEPYIAGRRFRKAYLGHSDDEIDAEWLPRGNAALEKIETALSDTPFLVGQQLTLADIVVVAYTRAAEEGGFRLADYPQLRAWISRVESALDLNPYGDE